MEGANIMIEIRPVSDLRNKFPEIEALVKENQPDLKRLWEHGGFESGAIFQADR